MSTIYLKVLLYVFIVFGWMLVIYVTCKQLLTTKNDAIVNDVDVNFGFHCPAVRLQTAVEGTNWVFGFATRFV